MASIFIVGGTGVGHESFSAEKVRDPASSASADSGFRPHAQYTHIVLLPVGRTKKKKKKKTKNKKKNKQKNKKTKKNHPQKKQTTPPPK